jgi:hypothetical protein
MEIFLKSKESNGIFEETHNYRTLFETIDISDVSMAPKLK